MPRSAALLLAGLLSVVAAVWLVLDGRSAPLGPADGADLPAADTGRVAVGDEAPDFTLESREGSGVTLSDFRGRKDVVLVFYRGHW